MHGISLSHKTGDRSRRRRKTEAKGHAFRFLWRRSRKARNLLPRIGGAPFTVGDDIPSAFLFSAILFYILYNVVFLSSIFLFPLFFTLFFAEFAASARVDFRLASGAKNRGALAFCAYCKKTGAHIWQNRQKCFCRKNRKL